jgi:hypothetical protein
MISKQSLSKALRALCITLLCGVLFSGAARAAKPCFPESPWMPINAIGKGYMEGADSRFGGTWRSVWCPTGQIDPATGMVVWTLYSHAVLDKYRTVSMTLVWEMGRMMVAAPDPLAELASAIKAREFIPPVGSSDRFNWESLLYAACLENVRVNPAGLLNVTNNCKVPAPVVVPVDVWRTPASGTFTLYTVKNGALSGIIAGRKATANATCDCAAGKATSGTSTYCALPGAPATEVTLCKKVAP